MNWFRFNKRSCARLALLALAVQMVVSFGHMHRDDLGLPPLPDTNSTQIAAGSPSVLPADQQHQSPSDDYCPICASMMLIATAIPSLPPALILPVALRPVWPSQLPARAVSPRVALSFQARGPPII